MEVKWKCGCGAPFETAGELIEYARTEHGVDVE